MRKCGPSWDECKLCGRFFLINPPHPCGCNKSNIQKNRNIKIDTIIDLEGQNLDKISSNSS